jgi:hypothetical protein
MMNNVFVVDFVYVVDGYDVDDDGSLLAVSFEY